MCMYIHFLFQLQCSYHAEVMEAIHNVAVTMGKKMDALMSVLSKIKKK